MKKNYKSILITFLLMICIVLTIIVGIFSLVSGPMRVQEKTNIEIMEKFNTVNKVEATQFLNRFVLSEVYYIAKSPDTIYVFNETGTLIYKQQNQTMNAKVSEQMNAMGLNENTLTYGYYKEQLVYVLKNKYYELYYSYTEGELLFNLKLEG